MTMMASQITSLTVVYSTVYTDADQRKHQSSASLAFVWGIHRDRWIPRTKGQLRGKCFHLMTSSWPGAEHAIFTLQEMSRYCRLLLQFTAEIWRGIPYIIHQPATILLIFNNFYIATNCVFSQSFHNTSFYFFSDMLFMNVMTFPSIHTHQKRDCDPQKLTLHEFGTSFKTLMLVIKKASMVMCLINLFAFVHSPCWTFQ